MQRMSIEERFTLIIRGTSEVITEAELRKLLQSNERPRAYIGFEPSGLMHIANGVIVSNKIKDFCAAGLDFTVLLADWHAYINDKLGGSMENIRACGEYFKECFTALGVPGSVRYVYASDLVSSDEYWMNVLRVSKNASVARIKRAMTIMGRKEEEGELDASKLIYPSMQVTDIHTLDLDVAYGGMDQRHAHMLYRDLHDRLGWKGIVAVHTPLMSGLQGGGRMNSPDQKMSKSDPHSAIFIHDSPEDIERKVDRAYCPAKVLDGNPILDIARLIIFPKFSRLSVERSRQHGGDIELSSVREMEDLYAKGELHPEDVKNAVARSLAQYLSPVRDYFEAHPRNLEAMKPIIGDR